MMDHTQFPKHTGQLFDSITCDLINNATKANNDSKHTANRSFPSPSTLAVVCETTHNICITSPVINTNCDVTSSTGYIDKKLPKELLLNTSNGIPMEKEEENTGNESFSNKKSPVEISKVTSQSLDESVEVQEYLQEEEIGVDEANKLSSSMHTADDAGVSTSEESPSYELQLGRKILKDIMSDSNRTVNWPFMNAVDSSLEGCHNYYIKIRRPMWLRKMEKKFENGEYKELEEFISDMRVMVDNCILFNGVDHAISKKAQKLECILEQKVALLTRDLREKINAVISPRSVLIMSEDTGLPKSNKREKDSRLRRREAMRMQAIKRKMIHDRFVEGLLSWDENLFDSTTKTHMRVMWELPQLGLFLYLCSKPLHLDISQYELERCFVLSKESICMQRMMTSLLSSTYRRPKLHSDGFMPARLWEEKLRENLSQWYKSLVEFNYDISAASEKLAIDERFFQILGLANPLEEKSFHELTYYQKVWIVKSICDHLLDVQKSLLDAIEKQELIDTRPHELGTDSDGNIYFYFSQFCGHDVRIYRQSPLPTVEIRPPEVYPEEKNVKRKRPKGASRRRLNKVVILEASETPRTRDSRLRQNPKQLKSYQVGSSEASGSDSECDSDKDVESKLEEESCASSCKSAKHRLSTKQTTLSEEVIRSVSPKVETNTKIFRNSKVLDDSISENVIDPTDWAPADTVMPRRSLRKIIEESKKDAVPKNKSRSSKTSAKKSLSPRRQQQQQLTESDWKVFEPFMNERNLRSRKPLADNSAVAESKKTKPKKATQSEGKIGSKNAGIGNSSSLDGQSPEKEDVKSLSQSDNSETKRETEEDSLPIATESFAPGSVETVVDDGPGGMGDEDLICEDIKEEESEYPDEADVKVPEEIGTEMEDFVVKQPENLDPSIMGPDMDEFQLVAESIQDLRVLVSQFQRKTDSEEDDQSAKNGLKKNCEKILLESLTNLLEQLEPHESKLNQMLKKRRMDLRKEQESYKEPPDVPLDEAWDNNEVSSASPKSTSGSNSIFGEANSDVSQLANPPAQQRPVDDKPIKEKKSIFDDDFDVALLLSQGRVLRKRNNPEPPSSNIPTSRSRRLLNKSSRYKSDDYLLDDRLIASACNRKFQEDSNSKTFPSSAASSSSSRDFSQSMEVDLFQPSPDRTIYKIQGGVLSQKTDKLNFVSTNSHVNGSNVATDSPAFKCSQLSNSISQSMVNTTSVLANMAPRVTATATPNIMKLSSHSLFQALNFQKNSILPTMVVPALSTVSSQETDQTTTVTPNQRIISDLLLKKISNSGKVNNMATNKMPTSSLTSPSKQSLSQSINILNNASMFLPQYNSKPSMTHSSPVQTSVSPTIMLNRNIVQTSVGSPIGFLSGENGIIFIAKNLNSSPLSQSSFQKVNVQPQLAIPRLPVNNHVIRAIPLNSESQGLQRPSLNSNSMVNLQNVVPSQASIHNTFNIGNKAVNGISAGPSNAGSTVARPGTAVLNIQNIKDLNISNLSVDSKLVIPISFSEHRNPSSSVVNNVHMALNSSQIQPSHSNVSSLLSLFGANASLFNKKQQGTRVLGQLPIQVGQMNPGNSQQILVLTSMPSNTQNLATPIQLQRFVALPSPSKPASSLIPSPLGKATRTLSTLTIPSEPITLQAMTSLNSNAAPNSISLHGATHQLISPGLVPVNAVQPSLNTPLRGNIPLVVVSKSLANSTNHEIRRPVVLRTEGQNIIEKSTADTSHVSFLLKASDLIKLNKQNQQTK